MNPFFLKLLDQQCHKFSEVMNLMSSPNCHLRFSIVVVQTLKSEWQCSSSKTNCNLHLAESLISKISNAQKQVNLVFLDNLNPATQGLLERLDFVYPLCGRVTGRNRDVLLVVWNF